MDAMFRTPTRAVVLERSGSFVVGSRRSLWAAERVEAVVRWRVGGDVVVLLFLLLVLVLVAFLFGSAMSSEAFTPRFARGWVVSRAGMVLFRVAFAFLARAALRKEAGGSPMEGVSRPMVDG